MLITSSDPVGCIITKNLLQPDATIDEIFAVKAFNTHTWLHHCLTLAHRTGCSWDTIHKLDHGRSYTRRMCQYGHKLCGYYYNALGLRRPHRRWSHPVSERDVDSG